MRTSDHSEAEKRCWTGGACRALLAILLTAILGIAPSVRAAEKAGGRPGLLVRFESGGKVDHDVLQQAALFVPAGTPATPFLPAGKFNAVWSGKLSVDLRGEFVFQARVAGKVKLELNGATVLDAGGDGTKLITSEVIKMNKGANEIKVTFDSPDSGDAMLRVGWAPKGGFFSPLPLAQLSCDLSADATASLAKHLGREMFGEFRCVKCHTTTTTPDLNMDAPVLDGIGSRRGAAWIAAWVRDPKSVRPSARMPRVLKGDKAAEDADAIAAYLATLKEGDSGKAVDANDERMELGRKLFTGLHCVACHLAPDGNETDPARISLKGVAAKFTGGNLFKFLKAPESHFSWTRMPNFRFTDAEAEGLSVYLAGVGDKPAETAISTEAAVIEKGRKLVAESGCVNCHTLKLPGTLTAKAVKEIPADGWSRGCMAETAPAGSRAPDFQLTAEQRAGLKAFAASDVESLARDVEWEFASRQSRLLRCTECHGKFEGYPAFEVLGGKLKPEWAGQFIAGKVEQKPRFWLESRMPSFAQRAPEMARGLAMTHGYAPTTAPEPAADPELAKAGQVLVSAQGGFSCVQCHGMAKIKATQVFESNGINLALTGDRIQHDYYYRWVRGPLLIDPSTKMPVYFDETGKSPLTEILGGDGDKQIEAIWNYIRLGDKMPPPPGTEPAQ